MDRNFWSDLFPISETRRRLSQSAFRRIYLPIGAFALIAVVLAAAVLGSDPGDGFSHAAQLATAVMAMTLLAAGFVAWLCILAAVWGLNDALEILPAITSRTRLRFVIVVRSWRRRILGVRRIAASAFRILSPAGKTGAAPREGSRDDQGD
jgi:hypothetical protein